MGTFVDVQLVHVDVHMCIGLFVGVGARLTQSHLCTVHSGWSPYVVRLASQPSACAGTLNFKCMEVRI